MLTFLIPLLSKRVAKSWRETSDLLDRTLHSIYAQTSDRYQVLIVGNEPPDLELPENVKFLPVDFPLPKKFDDPYKTNRARERDRSAKVTYGLLYLYQTGDRSAYVMPVDADDLISRRIVEFTERRARETPGHPGWFLRRGYRYRDGSNWIYIMRKGFDGLCASSIVTRLDVYHFLDEHPEVDLAEAVHWSPEFDTLVDRYNSSYRHRDIIKTLTERGQTLERLPFPGGIYVMHADNMSLLFIKKSSTRPMSLQSVLRSLKSFVMRLKARLDIRYFGKKLRREFGLDLIH